MRYRDILGAALLFAAPAYADDGSAVPVAETGELAAPLQYPRTRKDKVVEDHFGTKVADPYRWLEGDVRTDKDVAAWVDAENAVTHRYLDTLPGRDALAAQMKQLYDYERYGLPVKANGRYFFTKNSGLQNQSVLYVRKGLNGKDRALINPNLWAKDGATALDSWVPSKNGKLIAYSVQDGGTDWRIIKLLDVDSGKVLDDEIRWAKFTNIAWIGNEGFLYSRFPEPQDGSTFQSRNYNQTIYFHKIGTEQSEDEIVYASPDQPELSHSAQVTQDGQWIVIKTSKGTDDKYAVRAMPLALQTPGGGQRFAKLQPLVLVKGLDYDWQLIDGIGDTLYFATNEDAPRLKVAKLQLSNWKCAYSRPTGLRGRDCNSIFLWDDVIPQSEATLSSAQIVGDSLILSYLQDAKSIAEMTTLDGKPLRRITLSSIGTASGFFGKPGDPETFYNFASFNQPGTIVRFDSKTGKSSIFARPRLNFDPASIAVEQVFYPSKDGTQIPMFVVHRKDLDLSKGAPTLLYGYGGFNLAQTPSYDPRRMAWIQNGGVFALANLRGGSEYGEPWHDAGRLANKQNVFDDFAAAGEYLIAKGYTAKGKLAIEGRSNGGLLVGASLNQHPDLFAAGHAAVGVMDMLRFDRFTAGRYWVDDYGYPDKEADFKNLFGYSPYHNIKSGVDYPAIIVSTADTDDRVVPGHSFKYTAALQAADIGDKPHIIRIETRAGHGSGKPVDKLIAEYADIYAFLAKWTGLDIAATKNVDK